MPKDNPKKDKKAKRDKYVDAKVKLSRGPNSGRFMLKVVFPEKSKAAIVRQLTKKAA